MIDRQRLPRPFIKWAGGKSGLLDQIIPLLGRPKHYYEPFAGGAAVFFELKRQGLLTEGGCNVLSDSNAALVNVYHHIKYDVYDFMLALDSLASFNTAATYYTIRSSFDTASTDRWNAARFVYLNRYGFNGLYRVNKRGQFNVPFGKYKNPVLYDTKNMHAVSDALKRTQVNCESYRALAYLLRPDADQPTAVYFDPPYMPVSSSANFTSYTAHGFDLDDQLILRDIIVRLCTHGVRCVASNSIAALPLYEGRGLAIQIVKARRAINSKGSARGPVDEILISGGPL